MDAHKHDSGTEAEPDWKSVRAGVLRNAAGIGVATGAYGVSFGAIAVGTGLSVPQASVLSLFMFTGASQFAFLAVMAAHGSGLAAAFTALLLGTRNALYGLGLAPLLRVSPLRRPLAAHLVIDESTAMAIATPDFRAGRLGFWATGMAVFVCWNLGTLLGAVGARAVSNPAAFGLDAAVPAAFLALLAPRLRSRDAWTAAVCGAAIALAALPHVPVGVPVLLAATGAAIFGWRWAYEPGAPAGGMEPDRRSR